MTLKHVKALIIVVLVVVSYWPAFTAGFIWDDDWYIKSHPSFDGPSGLQRIWTDPTATFQYYPVVHTTFWLEWRLWGPQPMGYHVANVVLHTLNALILWGLLARLGVRHAWLIGVVFAVHPIMVESVAWVTERKNVLYTFFYLLSIGFFVEAFRLGSRTDNSVERDRSLPVDASSVPRRLLVTAGCLAYILALLSKTVACTLPVVLLLLFFWKGRRLTRGAQVFIAALTIIGGAFGALTVALERGTVGAKGETWSLSLLERALVAGRAVWFYLAKIIYPHDLTFIYPRWQIDSADAGGYLGLVSLVLVLLGLVGARRLIGNGPLIALLFFLVNVGPALGFFNVYPHRYSFVADHWQYLASVGILALVVTSLGSLFRRRGRWVRLMGAACAAICVCILVAASHSQCRIYRSQDTLWRDTIDKNPAAWMAHTNLGVLLLSRGEADSSIVAFNEALRFKPDHYVALNNLGFALTQVGRTDEAIRAYREALRLKPDYFLTIKNLAELYATHPDPRYRNLQEAERLALEACDLSDYQHPDALKVLADVYAGSGRFGEAIAIERKALTIAREAGARSMAQAIQRRIEAYRRQLP